METDAANLGDQLTAAAAAVRSAEALLIGAGAGMGVDSGLPDFRGVEGFWRAYPPFRALGRRFEEMSNPRWFHFDPEQAWGFFGHRLNLYRSTAPHAGFELLRRWVAQMPCGGFVFTSNVDGHFQRAGFDADRIVECHGSIHHMQCSAVCSRRIWEADGVEVPVDESSFRARTPLPPCRHCDSVARPNILMFGDLQWVPTRTQEQLHRYRRWLSQVAHRRLVVLEFGAGTAVPTVRYECENQSGTLIRVNPRDFHAPSGSISLPLGALEAIVKIDEALNGARD